MDPELKLLGVRTAEGESVKQVSAKVRKLLTLDDTGYVLKVHCQCCDMIRHASKFFFVFKINLYQSLFLDQLMDT